MFTVAEMSMNKKRKVITKCNGEKAIWSSREDAKAFFLEAMMSLENEERDRAECVYIQILHGLSVCTDE